MNPMSNTVGLYQESRLALYPDFAEPVFSVLMARHRKKVSWHGRKLKACRLSVERRSGNIVSRSAKLQSVDLDQQGPDSET